MTSKEKKQWLDEVYNQLVDEVYNKVCRLLRQGNFIDDSSVVLNKSQFEQICSILNEARTNSLWRRL